MLSPSHSFPRIEYISRTPEGPACIKPVANEGKIKGEDKIPQIMSFHLKQKVSQCQQRLNLENRQSKIRRSICPCCSSVVVLARHKLAHTCSQAGTPFTSSLQVPSMTPDTLVIWHTDKGPGGDRRIYSAHWLCLTISSLEQSMLSLAQSHRQDGQTMATVLLDLTP